MTKLILVLLDRDGKELARKNVITESDPETGPKRGPVEYQTGMKAMELYRDAFWKRQDVPH